MISQLHGEGVCTLLTTHDLDDAEKLADRVLIIDHGRLIAEGTPRELMESGSAEDFRFAGPPGIDTSSMETSIGAPVEEVTPGEYVVRTSPTPTAVASTTAFLAENDLPIADLRAGRQRLEDVFLRLTETSHANKRQHPGVRSRTGRRTRRGL